MRIIGVHSRVSPLLMAVVLVLPLSHALATGQPQAEQATIQGSRFPGMPVPSPETKGDRRRGPVDVTFTKWPTTGQPPLPAHPVPGRTLFQGFVGGDLGDGDFVGEVLDSKVSTACAAFVPPCMPGATPPTISGSIGALHAIYEVQVDENSFTALIQGGRNRATGEDAWLDGVIVAGWRAGARVLVTFETTTNCAGAPAGPCFQGVIRVGRVPDN
jgi:hypothetical protein